ncbi:MAG: deoxynucleoside kinase [Candidatus Tectomicrobia bacterium]|uniref:Deoxynucleoside kinase n=1 Tax=Tectimicrobiota bacterium TaxID=2528274 RepID=A0A932GQX7_UNCTE|nr:deoxynucleoside kinase [Candidatus Tectomicrobia bacterium]
MASETRYIAIEGPIGVGKTSLARLLGDAFQAHTVLEVAEKNPFLEDFYRDPVRYAFQAQIFFLLSRFRQQEELVQHQLFQQTTVCDYLFVKDRIFASVTLDDKELKLYDEVYQLLEPRVPKPDLVIYLQAELEVLLRRIRSRSREYERGIAVEYVEAVSRTYNEFFFHYRETPLLVINTSEIDFVNQTEDLQDLIAKIHKMKKGTEYDIPLGSR